MNPQADPLLWASRRILDRLVMASARTLDTLALGVESLLASFHRVEALWSRSRKAHQRQWRLAAGRLCRDLEAEVDGVACQAVRTREALSVPTPGTPVLRGILEELRQLDEDFADVRIDHANNTVVATTEPIVLEDVELGAFDIELHINRLSEFRGEGCFRCVARQPRPAQADSTVTHPHVRDGVLCAGDASAALATALSQGRIFDAFCLIKAVLEEYNPSSPYVSLENWFGQQCDDCGQVVDADDLAYCEHCQRDFCSACTGRCEMCDEPACDNCLERDAVSDRRCCPNCRHTCSGCGRTVDEEHFDAPSNLCPGCLGRRDHRKELDHEPQSPSAPGRTRQASRPRRRTPAVATPAPAGADAGVLAAGVAEAAVVPPRRGRRGRRVRHQRRG